METKNQQYGCETNRLLFVENRDGVEGALQFARQGLTGYRKAVLASRKRGHKNPHFASLPEYRSGYIESYLGFKAYIKANS